jgi:tetratricopeptide (TPR) repeat protein
MNLRTYNWENALESCEEVLKNDPEHVGALEVMAQALWFGGKFDQVIRTTSRLLLLNPLEPGYRYTRGMAYLSEGALTLAAEDFRLAIKQTNDPEFREQVANALKAVVDWQVAPADLQLSRSIMSRGGDANMDRLTIN